jgi:hypothetical protein
MPDGNFLIVAGASQLQGAQQEYGVSLLKVNQNGDTLWTKQYFWPEAHRLSAVAPAGDSGFVVAGFADSGQGTQAFLMKIASSGDTVWSRTFSTIPFGITAITPTLDGNFIAAASSASDQSAAACFFKTDSNGNTLWIKTYGGMAGPYTLTQARDGSFIAAGNTVVKISAGGDTVWTIPQKGQMLNTIAIAPYGDGSFITAGAQGPLGDLFLIIDDRYAKKDSLFTFKIPVLGDSLRFTYKAISSPSSMAASPGGTLSWIPGTDSAYVDHVAFVVSDSTITDTLTFNLFVNCRQRPSAIGRPKARLENISSSFRVLDGHFISFFVPGNEAWLEIYDIHGRLTEKLIVENHVAVWRSKNSTGWHCVRIRDFVKPFIVVR